MDQAPMRAGTETPVSYDDQDVIGLETLSNVSEEHLPLDLGLDLDEGRSHLVQHPAQASKEQIMLRNHFLRKIFGTLALHACLETWIILFCNIQDSVKDTILLCDTGGNSFLLVFVTGVLSLSLLTLTSSFGNQAAAIVLQVPFLLSTGVLVGYISVIFRLGIFQFIPGFMSIAYMMGFLYAMQSRWDFDICILFTFVVLPVLLMFPVYFVCASRLASLTIPIAVLLAVLLYSPMMFLGYSIVHAENQSYDFFLITMFMSDKLWAVTVMDMYLAFFFALAFVCVFVIVLVPGLICVIVFGFLYCVMFLLQ